jgi:hypothetical protein
LGSRSHQGLGETGLNRLQSVYGESGWAKVGDPQYPKAEFAAVQHTWCVQPQHLGVWLGERSVGPGEALCTQPPQLILPRQAYPEGGGAGTARRQCGNLARTSQDLVETQSILFPTGALGATWVRPRIQSRSGGSGPGREFNSLPWFPGSREGSSPPVPTPAASQRAPSSITNPNMAWR